jgi:hypothetical protein
MQAVTACLETALVRHQTTPPAHSLHYLLTSFSQVEESFAGVMAQVFLPDGKAAKDYIYERKVRRGGRDGGRQEGGISWTVRGEPHADASP